MKIVMAVVAPGWTARARRRVLAPLLLAAGIGAPALLVLYIVFTSRNWVALTLDSSFLAVVMVIIGLAVFARLVAVVEVWVDDGRRTVFDRVEIITGFAAAMALVGGSIAVVEVGRVRASIAPVFSSAGNDVLFDADAPVATTSTTTTTTTAPSTTALERDDRTAGTTTTTTTTTVSPFPPKPDSGIDGAAVADVVTVLLLGGDAGPGRGGLRTDSMILFSLHQPSGRASLISVPRNLERLLFPPGSPLEAEHPYGYDGIANAVYPDVSAHADLREAYEVGDIRPGVVAIAQGIGYSLDVTIHDYVLVDMQGFLDLIDALGGVTLRLSSAVPMPGNVPGARTQYPDVLGPGVVAMDGSTALGYVRSRKGDSDYRRAQRQRGLLAALAQQISLRDVALSFGDIAAAIGGTLRTSLTPDELTETLNVLGGETAIVESVGLVPPMVDVRQPNYDAMAKVVGAVQMALVTGEPSGY